MSEIFTGDCRTVLKRLPSHSVDCCVTSPPYYCLRDYGMADQIGLEETPAQYVEELVKVFREVKRVLKDDGTLWINIGDSYDDKSLIGVPWLLAFALKNDGWYLRQDIIWHKPNPMPESVKDRCVKAHEYIFLLSKNPHYYFDYEAIQEMCVTQNEPINTPDCAENELDYNGSKYSGSDQEASVRQGMHRERGNKIIAVRRNLPTQDKLVSFLRKVTTVDQIVEITGIKKTTVEHWFRKDRTGFSYPSADEWRLFSEYIDDFSKEFQEINYQLTDVTYETDAIGKNNNGKKGKRDVWSVSLKPCKESHFATFPEDLIRPCILAGSRPKGLVLDPFFGSGTTGRVATELNREYIGIELNPEYIEISNKRTNNVQMSLFGF